jgi:hypothetical protein
MAREAGEARSHDNGGEGAAAALTRRATEAPLVALAGGLAVGAVIGALLPRTNRERELLSGVGERVADGARGAVETAREATVAKVAELGKAAVNETVHTLTGATPES